MNFKIKDIFKDDPNKTFYYPITVALEYNNVDYTIDFVITEFYTSNPETYSYEISEFEWIDSDLPPEIEDKIREEVEKYLFNNWVTIRDSNSFFTYVINFDDPRK